jgi:hypothetical protein
MLLRNKTKGVDMKTMCAKMGGDIFQGIINMNEAYRERMMKTTTYKAAQQSYDSQEHPDYWNDREEENEREAEMKKAEHYADYSEEDEHRMEWDELSDAGRQRRMERNYEMADLRREGLKEDELIRSMKRLPGDHDGWPSDEQMGYFKRGGR